jgi:hypothetical protein
MLPSYCIDPLYTSLFDLFLEAFTPAQQHSNWRRGPPIKEVRNISETFAHATFFLLSLSRPLSLSLSKRLSCRPSSPTSISLRTMNVELAAASPKIVSGLTGSRINSARLTPVAKELPPSYDEPAIEAQADPAIFMSAAPVAWEHRPPRVIKLSEQAHGKALSMSKATVPPDTCQVTMTMNVVNSLCSVASSKQMPGIDSLLCFLFPFCRLQTSFLQRARLSTSGLPSSQWPFCRAHATVKIVSVTAM